MGSTDDTVSDRLARSALGWSVATSARGSIALLALGLAVSWASTYLSGGADGIVPHLYYVPIAFAAVRFGPATAIVVALLSGVLAGPLTYVDVGAGQPQEVTRWLTRAGFFVVVGTAVALLVRPSLPSIADELRRSKAERRLRRAIADGEIVVRYQPIVHLRTGRIRAVEALVRWQHPVRGELLPAAFLPMAETSPVIHELGAHVLQTACSQAAAWQRRYGRAEAPIVSVNTSARELDDANLIDRVARSLKDHELDPSLLCLEITESVLVSDTQLSAARLAALRTLGVRLAIDDFGTGYSSLAIVHRFPLDVLKIDRGFVAPIGADEVTEGVLWGLVVLAGSLSLTTVAEGVETEEQDRVVASLGYHLAQGFHYAEPLLAHEVDELLAARTPLREPAADQQPPSIPRPGEDRHQRR